MKIGISATIDMEQMVQIEKFCKERHLSRSQFLGTAIDTYFKGTAPKLITCIACGSEYSNKLDSCPSCRAVIQRIQGEIQHERDVATLQERLDKLLDWKEKGMYVSQKEIDTVRVRLRELKETE